MKSLGLGLLMIITQVTWSVPPKISQPQEGALITTNQMLLFLYPTPTDVLEKRWINVEILEKSTHKTVLTNRFPPLSNYRVTLDLQDISNGEYRLKIFYTKKNGEKLTGDSERNFILKKIVE